MGRLLRGGVDRNLQAQVRPSLAKLSPPSRGRGSKRLISGGSRSTMAVASFAGAWIETMVTGGGKGTTVVASFAGAWIETLAGIVVQLRWCCRLLRGGVDRNNGCQITGRSVPQSPPSRGRGSKQRQWQLEDRDEASPPSRGRGSKPYIEQIDFGAYGGRVASFAGAWIETLSARLAGPGMPVASFAGAWIETSHRR